MPTRTEDIKRHNGAQKCVKGKVKSEVINGVRRGSWNR